MPQIKTARHFGSETYLNLKAACRDVVALAGGISRCVGLTRASQSKLSEALSPAVEDRFMAIDQIMDLEADCGQPVVSRFLAGLAGYDLTPFVASGQPRTLYQEFSKLILDGADVQARFATAMAEGQVEAKRIPEILVAIDRQLEDLHELKASLMQAQDKLRVVK